MDSTSPSWSILSRSTYRKKMKSPVSALRLRPHYRRLIPTNRSVSQRRGHKLPYYDHSRVVGECRPATSSGEGAQIFTNCDRISTWVGKTLCRSQAAIGTPAQREGIRQRSALSPELSCRVPGGVALSQPHRPHNCVVLLRSC